jgi:hypothetical protein
MFVETTADSNSLPVNRHCAAGQTTTPLALGMVHSLVAGVLTVIFLSVAVAIAIN